MKTLIDIMVLIGDAILDFIWSWILPIGFTFIIIFIVVSLLISFKSKIAPETNRQYYESELFTDDDGCIYKIIKQNNMRKTAGVVLYSDCKKAL